jgi:hypothetical protein
MVWLTGWSVAACHFLLRTFVPETTWEPAGTTSGIRVFDPICAKGHCFSALHVRVVRQGDIGRWRVGRMTP